MKKFVATLLALAFACCCIVSVAAIVSDNSPSVSVKGDVNGNGEVDSTDYMLIKRAYFGTYVLSEDEANAADINDNGEIDSTDYMLVKRIYFGTYTYATPDEATPDELPKSC